MSLQFPNPERMFTGADRLVTGDPTDWVAHDIPRDRRNGRPIEAYIGDFPLSPEALRQLEQLYASKRVTLAHLADDAARADYLARVSYVAFLRQDWGLCDDAIAYFGGRTLDFFGLPPNLVPALDATLFAYPGFAGISLPTDEAALAELDLEAVRAFRRHPAPAGRSAAQGPIPHAAVG